MLSKTIKVGFSLLFAATLLAACSSSATKDDNTQSTQPEVTTPPTVEAAPVDDVDIVEINLATVFYFEFDQSTLTQETRALLTAHAAALRANPRSIRLEGYADERGTREYNIALGERRALAVRDYLRSEGVNSPMEVVSYGEERPVNTASNEIAWQENRRVELK